MNARKENNLKRKEEERNVWHKENLWEKRKKMEKNRRNDINIKRMKEGRNI